MQIRTNQGSAPDGEYHSLTCYLIGNNKLCKVFTRWPGFLAVYRTSDEFNDFIKNEGLDTDKHPNTYVLHIEGPIGIATVTFYNQEVAVRFMLQFS